MKQSKNRGTAIIELTFLIAFIIILFYYYIIFFLSKIDYGKCYIHVVECAYQLDTINEGLNQDVSIKMQGDMEQYYKKFETGIFSDEIVLYKSRDTSVERIRRWQFATGRIRQRR